jgi:hypothetical protein
MDPENIVDVPGDKVTAQNNVADGIGYILSFNIPKGS